MDINIESQIVVQTSAQWAADNTVYSAKRILVTSDVYYGSTDQRKFKIADGVQTWSNLDYMPIEQVTTSTIGSAINGAASAIPNDTDLVMSVDSSVAKKNTWTQVKAFLKTYFDTVYQATGSYLTSANITQTITNGVTTNAPSEDAVFDALALKADKSNTVLTTYLEIPEQSKPATPTNAFRLYADTSNRLSWIGENGYVRTLDGTANTADRTYTLPNKSGTIAINGEDILVGGASTNLAQNTTYNMGQNISLAVSTSTTARAFKFQFAGTLEDVNVMVSTGNNASSENCTLELRDITNSTSQTIGTITYDAGINGNKFFSFSSLNLSINTTSVYTIRVVTAVTFATAPTGVIQAIRLKTQV